MYVLEAIDAYGEQVILAKGTEEHCNTLLENLKLVWKDHKDAELRVFDAVRRWGVFGETYACDGVYITTQVAEFKSKGRAYDMLYQDTGGEFRDLQVCD